MLKNLKIFSIIELLVLVGLVAFGAHTLFIESMTIAELVQYDSFWRSFIATLAGIFYGLWLVNRLYR